MESVSASPRVVATALIGLPWATPYLWAGAVPPEWL